MAEVIKEWNWEDGHWFGLNGVWVWRSFGGVGVGDRSTGERKRRRAGIERNVSFMGGGWEGGSRGKQISNLELYLVRGVELIG